MTTAAELIHSYFPDSKYWDGDDFFLAEGWLRAGGLTSAVDLKVELERVSRIEKLIFQLWHEFKSLPLAARSGKNDDFMRVAGLYRDLTGHDPFAKHRSIKSAKDSDISSFKSNLSVAYPTHHKQRDADFAAKVQLVRTAREIWQRYSGKEPPLKPSEGSKYHRFVGDLIGRAGREWGVDNCIRAWRTFEKGT